MLPSAIFREYRQMIQHCYTVVYSNAEHVLRTISVHRRVEPTRPIGLNTVCCTLGLHVAGNSFYHNQCQFYVTMCQHVL